MDNVGRVVIPRDFRKKLGMSPGSELVVRLEANEIRLTTKELSRRRAKELAAVLVPKGVSLSQELIGERRKAAKDC